MPGGRNRPRGLSLIVDDELVRHVLETCVMRIFVDIKMILKYVQK